MTKTYPHWIFDGSEIADPLGHGERAVKFLRALRHPKSTAPKQAFHLDHWQERIIRRVYGPRNDDGTRIVKTVVLLIGRGNRKTSLAGALSLLHTIGPERIPGGENILAASDRKQAGYGFREAANIIHPRDCDLASPISQLAIAPALGPGAYVQQIEEIDRLPYRRAVRR